MALASDSYIPLHPDADQIPLPTGYFTGPKEFLKVCSATLRYFVKQGVSREEALKLITVNGRKLIKPKEPIATLSVGRPADVILCDCLPALETTAVEDIKVVIIAGRIQVDRRMSTCSS
jgi:imidazolonepropionase-like amidohydrolase